MSHTPGPWKVEQEFEYGPTSITAADGSSLMCSEDYYPSVPSNDDDWSLIAAAPEMLEELRHDLRVMEECAEDTFGMPTSRSFQERADAIRAVIAKATGGQP